MFRPTLCGSAIFRLTLAVLFGAVTIPSFAAQPRNSDSVAIEPNDGRSGSTFALVYVHTRGKRGDI